MWTPTNKRYRVFHRLRPGQRLWKLACNLASDLMPDLRAPRYCTRCMVKQTLAESRVSQCAEGYATHGENTWVCPTGGGRTTRRFCYIGCSGILW